MCNNTRIYHYYQLLNPTFDNLVKGTDNPAGIPDGTHLSSAKKIAKDWMKKNGVNNAVLVKNVVTDSTDNIEKIKLCESLYSKIYTLNT